MYRMTHFVVEDLTEAFQEKEIRRIDRTGEKDDRDGLN